MRPIDADALKEWVEEYHASNWGIPQDELIYAIGSAPTIDTVKHGKWIKIVDCNTVQCSECFEDFDYIDGICYLCHGQELPDYCPNCGARMDDKEQKGEIK